MKGYEKEIADQIDSMPIEQARIKIASGSFGGIGSPTHAFASSWLSAREANLRDAREAEMKPSDKASGHFPSPSTRQDVGSRLVFQHKLKPRGSD